MRIINLVNKSTKVSPSVFALAIPALQKQLDQHVAAMWNMTATLLEASEPVAESIILMDNSDQADALGYHELDKGEPTGFVFAETAAEDGDTWTSVLSHELLEQLVDPYACVAAFAPWRRKAAAIAWEICDPVESDSYQIDGITVSNFVFPNWFTGQPTGRVDYLNTLKGKSLSMTPGGYVAFCYQIGKWQQTLGQKHQHTHHKYSRPVRRKK